MNTVTKKDLADLYSGLEAMLLMHPDTATEPALVDTAVEEPGALIAGEAAAQGDLLFVPLEQAPHWAQHRGEVTLVGDGNGHRLTPAGITRWATLGGDLHLIGVFEVVSGTATIDQPRRARGATVHTPLVFGRGVWQVRRQVAHVAPRILRRRID
jgi:hypothetical protein